VGKVGGVEDVSSTLLVNVTTEKESIATATPTIAHIRVLRAPSTFVESAPAVTN
jgi:hypothetical protein